MKLRVLRKSFFEALSVSTRFTAYKAQLPILGNILLEAKDNKLNICATNLEMSVSIPIAAKIESEGKITVPSKTLHDVVSNLKGENIDLEVDKEQIRLVCDKFSSQLLGINASDFPSIPTTVSKSSFEISPDLVLVSLPKVLYCVSQDETRPSLTGVLFLLKDEKISLVATDGFRLSKVDSNLKDLKTEAKIIIPKSILMELTRVAKDQKVILDYQKEERQIVFKVGDSVLSSRVIEGEFPDFEKTIPTSFKLNINIDKEEMLQAVKLASVFARDASNVVRFIASEKSLKFEAESTQAGNQENVLDVKADVLDKSILSDKSDFTIAFNCRFVEEFLNSIDGGSVDLKFNDANSPGVFLDSENKDLLHLIMPIKI